MECIVGQTVPQNGRYCVCIRETVPSLVDRSIVYYYLFFFNVNDETVIEYVCDYKFIYDPTEEGHADV